MPTPHVPADPLVESILKLKRLVSERAIAIDKHLALADDSVLPKHHKSLYARLRNANRCTPRACNLVGEAYTMLLDLVLVQRMLLDATEGKISTDPEVNSILHDALSDASLRSNTLADACIDIYSEIKA